MTRPSRLRVQSAASLRDEMIAVSLGARRAPRHANQPSVHSADLIARLLTVENRALLATIYRMQPESVAELAELTNRAPANVTRTLDKLAAIGLVHFVVTGRRKAPRTTAGRIIIEIDPFTSADIVRFVRRPKASA